MGCWLSMLALPSATSLSVYSFDRIEANGMAILTSRSGSGFLSLITTVRSSVLVTDSVLLSRPTSEA
ncbi:hypothetical protein D9M68_849930 [compost metagenome]